MKENGLDWMIAEYEKSQESLNQLIFSFKLKHNKDFLALKEQMSEVNTQVAELKQSGLVINESPPAINIITNAAPVASEKGTGLLNFISQHPYAIGGAISALAATFLLYQLGYFNALNDSIMANPERSDALIDAQDTLKASEVQRLIGIEMDNTLDLIDIANTKITEQLSLHTTKLADELSATTDLAKINGQNLSATTDLAKINEHKLFATTDLAKENGQNLSAITDLAKLTERKLIETEKITQSLLT